ncbi:MAG: plastocyanin/azurin family copper-binding protein [candidate division KSB1 bacterium]|nr:plastocyanin/azurin family copper-binding protein [candidate division KSB1 bacterium]MDZ7301433.1 plastocyanin/azurin family copper-binding protein [candidate division KSB1 bacterium]MDZ7313465.1 plastocyanin/azurin family copper-binding protein [candidate division KSB1 bacterium]
MWFCEFKRTHRRVTWRLGLLLLLTSLLAVISLRCGDNPLQPEVRGPNEVWIIASGFDPATLTVAMGTTVTWINKDNVKHDVTSGLPGNVANDFDPSPNLNPNDRYSVTFTRRGTFNYFCTIHRTAHGTGKIVVQ